jgi:hypothetical protein
MTDFHTYTESQASRQRGEEYVVARGRYEPRVIEREKKTMSDHPTKKMSCGGCGTRVDVGISVSCVVCAECSRSLPSEEVKRIFQKNETARNAGPALLAALKGLEYPKEPGVFCDHPVEPCPRCKAAREAIALAEAAP